MATCFDRWEKDPFFPAAEEVQESADRMESVYRRWIHERKDTPYPAGEDATLTGDLRRELHTAKWQLEELERAVTSNDDECSVGEDTRSRHSQFVEAIGNQISNVENSLKEANVESSEGTGMSRVPLDEGERDDLALFLSGSLPPLPPRAVYPVEVESKNGVESLKNQRRVHGHRRTASASADFGVLQISVSNEDGPPHVPPPKTASFSNLTKVLEAAPKMKWPKNGFRKWKGGDQHHEDETIPLHNQQISQGLNACYERSKSYLSSCGDGSYDKQLYGWLGVFQRQLQRSQYHFQYGCTVQVILWTTGVVLLIVLLAMCLIQRS